MSRTNRNNCTAALNAAGVERRAYQDAFEYCGFGGYWVRKGWRPYFTQFYLDTLVERDSA